MLLYFDTNYFLTCAQGQTAQWDSHHKKLCKRLNSWTTSPSFQRLPRHERLDATLMSHLIAQMYIYNQVLLPNGQLEAKEPSSLSAFVSLLPGSQDASVPPICPFKDFAMTNDSLVALYSRFGNNNFAVHSHLRTYAHGIFPSASRSFNHSCLPNAASKYIIQQGQPVKMQVVALRQIEIGEEVTRFSSNDSDGFKP